VTWAGLFRALRAALDDLEKTAEHRPVTRDPFAGQAARLKCRPPHRDADALISRAFLAASRSPPGPTSAGSHAIALITLARSSTRWRGRRSRTVISLKSTSISCWSPCRLRALATPVVLRDFQLAYEVVRLIEGTIRLVREQHLGQTDALQMLTDRMLRLNSAMYEGGCSPDTPLIKD